MKENTEELKVNQQVEILEFGKKIQGVIVAIKNSNLIQARNVKVKIRSRNTKSGYAIIAKKKEYVFPIGIL